MFSVLKKKEKRNKLNETSFRSFPYETTNLNFVVKYQIRKTLGEGTEDEQFAGLHCCAFNYNLINISGLVDPSELVANIEKQIEKAKEECLSRREISDRITKWVAALDEENWLEEYNQVNILPYFFRYDINQIHYQCVHE
jgi:hypothetical protein